MGERYWAADHPVLAVLRAWRATRDRGRALGRSQRLGLVVQGGGMQGVFSGGMLTGLADLGLVDAFDAVYASSSGAVNSAYIYGDRFWQGLAIYWDHLASPRFIHRRRRLVGRDAIDLDYAFGTVVAKAVPFDARAVLESTRPLHVAITLVDELRAVAVSDFRSADDLLSALRATSWIPGVVSGTATFRGRRALDGSLVHVHPYHFAVADGCTHILSLSTQTIGPMRSWSQRVCLPVMKRYLDRIEPGLGRCHEEAGREYRADRATLLRSSASGSGPPHILDLAPLPWMPDVGTFESDPGRVMLMARYGYELVVGAVDGVDPAGLRTREFSAGVHFSRVERPASPDPPLTPLDS